MQLRKLTVENGMGARNEFFTIFEDGNITHPLIICRRDEIIEIIEQYNNIIEQENVKNERTTIV